MWFVVWAPQIKNPGYAYVPTPDLGIHFDLELLVALSCHFRDKHRMQQLILFILQLILSMTARNNKLLFKYSALVIFSSTSLDFPALTTQASYSLKHKSVPNFWRSSALQSRIMKVFALGKEMSSDCIAWEAILISFRASWSTTKVWTKCWLVIIFNLRR